VLTVYLCGGINALSDSDAKDWREAAKVALAGKVLFLDPMRRDYRGRENEPGIPEEIVCGDKLDIEISEIVLVNANKPSWGTGMELFMAHGLGKYIVTVCDSPKPSPWLVHHSSVICKSFAEAFQLVEEYAR
jgi:hypothetical protein